MKAKVKIIPKYYHRKVQNCDITHFYNKTARKKITSALLTHLGIRLHRDFISITSNVDLADILHSEGDVTQNHFGNWIRMSQIKTLFHILVFQKRIVLKKYIRAIGFLKVISENKSLIWLILFQLLNLYLWKASHCPWI